MADVSSIVFHCFPLIARKSSGFARILPDFILPENGYLKNSRGGGGEGADPMGRMPMDNRVK